MYFEIDDIIILEKSPIRFFSSRTIPNISYYFKCDNKQYYFRKNLGIGMIIGIGSNNNTFFLNRDNDDSLGNSISLEPFKLSVTNVFIDGGISLFWQYKKFQISTYVTTNIAWSSLNLVIESYKETGSDFFSSVSIGIEPEYRIEKNISIPVGFKFSYPLTKNLKYEIEDGLILSGKFTFPIYEFNLGIKFYVE
jgi:hypothetical protein